MPPNRPRQAISKDLTGRLSKHSVGRPSAEAREKARRNLEAFAHERHPDDEPSALAWLAEMLDALGLQEPAP